jgi:CubicO group peptidase (beta-lactamase class C family)
MATAPVVRVATAVATTAFSPLFSALLFAQAPDRISDSLRARIDSVFLDVDHTTSPGCALGIYRDGQIAYARGYGMANLELGVPITPRSVFNVGSVSKQFTATAILLLVQEGRVRLDDPLRRYLFDLPSFAGAVTVRHVLRHTSGLPEQLVLEWLRGRSFDTEIMADEIWERVAAAGQLNFAPGSYWTYNNTGFFLAARLVERISGQPIDAFTQKRIFRPLGMSSTAYKSDFRRLIPGRASGYNPTSSGTFETAPSNHTVPGPGGVHTSIEDLAKWDGNFARHAVGGQALIDSLMAEGTLASGEPTWRGYNNGMWTIRTGSYQARGHGGNWVGYTATYRHYSSAHLGLAALCNINQFDLEERVERVARLLLGLPPPDQGTRDSARVAQAAVAFAGFWRDRRSGVVIRLRNEGNGLRPGFTGGKPLVIMDDRRARNQDSTLLFRVEPFAGGKRILIRAPQPGPADTLDLMTGTDTTAASALPLAGAYVNPALGITWTVHSAGNRVVIHGAGNHYLPTDSLEAVGDNTYADDLLTVRFIRQGRGRASGLIAAMPRTWNVRLERRPDREKVARLPQP